MPNTSKAPPSLTEAEQRAIIDRYMIGEMGTRDVIEALGLDDFADLVIALSGLGYRLPKPLPSKRRDEHLAAAARLLGPRLRRG